MNPPIVIKYGGSLLEEPKHRSAFLKEVAALAKREKVILVHGGGKAITRQMEQQGIQPKFVDGRRYTDGLTMFFVENVLGSLNQEIVEELSRYGASCEGLSGRRDHLVEGDPIPDLGQVGQNLRVDAQVLEEICARIRLPVFYSVGEDASRNPLNVNADEFALALAVACQAGRLVYLTDAGGVLDAKGKLLPKLTPKDVERLSDEQVIAGGMLVKAQACVEALRQGVGGVDIVKEIRYLLEPGQTLPEGTIFAKA